MKKSFLAKLGSALFAIILITACNGTEEEPTNEEPTEEETNTEESGEGETSEDGS
ncbi:hypothetical protein [Pseudalkalibacillus salsuginis]|uniref:hypothetical protein n=1 Tax=Pseudalkalibacillus salsuginis TaxID=2910972 RepID=UPI001CD6C8B2|nr:hypothetical protein [Pseudalkalibacillus salsuginis]MCF6410968.1 hypothetical protein [Pseudalkalibacillus salsuginis]